MSLQPHEKGKAILCGDQCSSGRACDNDFVQLPAELRASYPAELSYVIMAIHSDRSVETCEYYIPGQVTEFGTISQKAGDIQRYRKTYTLRIHRLGDKNTFASQSFSGSVPGACPQDATFFYDQAGNARGGDENSYDIYGGDPSSNDILEWIENQIGE